MFLDVVYVSLFSMSVIHKGGSDVGVISVPIA